MTTESTFQHKTQNGCDIILITWPDGVINIEIIDANGETLLSTLAANETIVAQLIKDTIE